MLQALTKSGNLISPALLRKSELEGIRLLKYFYCPRCKERVVFRAGEQVIPHFAHQNVSDCSRKGGESDYHLKGKLQLYHWLRSQYQEVHLEKYIHEINQRPDIYIKVAHRKIAIELQCAVIPPKIIRQRNKGYKKAGIMPIWFIGANCFKRTGSKKIKINSFILETLQRFSSNQVNHMIYYCPDTHKFFKASDPHFVNNHSALVQLTYHHIRHTTLPELLRNSNINKQPLYTLWFHEKNRLRLRFGRQYGREQQWRRWLYEKKLYIHQLPSVIHLPVSSQYRMKHSLWDWQSRFIVEFLHPLPASSIFSVEEVKEFLKPYQKKLAPPLLIEINEEPALDYLQLLETLHYVQRVNAHTYQKVKTIIFPVHVDEAMKADREILQKLLKRIQEENNGN